ncbi:MAG: hypothetical protein EOO36_03090 [Cytophagaceae bacterium]|nr:MAG: hypothetical protein EOO36_03090 [Cytophagaceae bacterium]
MLNLYVTLRRFAWTALLSGGGLLTAQAQTLGQTVAGATNVAGTYTDLGTTGTAITTANTDNANSTAQDIGFSFSYRGVLYTQFVLNTNGLIRLGSAAPSAAAMYIDPNTPIVGVDPVGSLSAADVNLLMPFNLDLIAGTGGTEYRVATTGATGSRVCTIQWKNVADKAGTSSGSAQQYSNISFQAKLYEAGGTVEFVYGAATASAAAANLRSVNVGLKGATTGSSQLLLATKASPSAWSATTFRNTAYGFNTHDIDKTALPTAGRTYRFTDPTYCVPVPITTYPYTQSFDAATAPLLPCGVTVADVNADSKTWVNTSSTANAASAPNAMTYSYSATNAANDWFFTNALQMRVGYSYQLQFKYKSYSSTLAEALEVKVGNAATAAAQTATVFTNATVNNTAYATTVAGTRAGQVLLFTPTAAGTYYFGFHAISRANAWYLYVDDVQVTEVVAPACPAPTALAVGGITATGATVSFSGPTNGTSYTAIYGPRGFVPPAGGTSAPAAAASPVTLSGLTPNTPYDVYVQATCGTAGTSTLTGPVAFSTTCLPVTTFPYLENFDGVTAPALPCGVAVLDANTDGKTWANAASSAYAASAPNVMQYSYSGTNAANDWFFTNALSLQAGSTYQLQFKYRAYSATWTEGLEVKVGAGATAADQTTTVFTNNNITNPVYATTAAGTAAGQVASFTPTTSGLYYFGFHAISAVDEYNLYVDDVRVDITSIAACPTPTNLVVSGITATAASVAFTGPTALASGYTVIYGPPGFDPNTGGTRLTTSTSPVALTNLTAQTSYDVYVRATCSASLTSYTSAKASFKTACVTTLTYPYLEKFDGVTAPGLPCGITVLDANNDGSTWGNSNYNPSSGANSMRYNPSASNAADDWFFTNALDLRVNTRYQLEFKYRVFSYNYPERMEVKIGSSTTAASQTTTLFSNLAIINNAYTTTSPGAATGQVLSFTPTTAGTYFIGFHAMSIANSFDIYVDDIAVTAMAVTATTSSVAPGFRAEASPVPFSDHLTLTLNTLAAGPLHLTLHDGVGRVVRQTTAPVPAGASSLAVPDAGTLPAGIYILTVRQGGNTQVIRVAHE